MDKKDLLITLIQDTQEASRFTETKTVVIVSILGGIVVNYISDIDEILKNFNTFSCCNYILVTLVLLCLVVNIYFLAKIIVPIANPVDKLAVELNKYPNLFISDENINNNNFSDYKKALKNKNILNSLQLEYIKVSLIRNNKIKFYKKLIVGSIIQVVLFIIHLLIYRSELLALIITN